MLQMLALVCAIGTAPADCTADTALDILVNRRVAMPTECAITGLQAAAGTGMIERGDGTYLKISCRPARKS